MVNTSFPPRSFHGIVAKQGTGTVACIEAKLLQQMPQMVQKILYSIFLDISESHDTVNRKRLLEIMEGYGMGPNTLLVLL